MAIWHVDGEFCDDPLCGCAERAYELGIISRRTLLEQMKFSPHVPPFAQDEMFDDGTVAHVEYHDDGRPATITLYSR
jgi:hypothetical protein